MKRLSVLFFILLFLLCGCSRVPVQPPSDTTAVDVTAADTTAAETVPTNTFTVVSGGASDFRIIRGDTCGAEVTRAAAELYDAIADATGTALGITTDWVKEASDIPVGTAEILVGMTNRAESQQYAENLSADDYVIAVSGSRVVLLGGTPAATARAVERFITHYLTGEELVLPADLYFTSAGYYPASITIAGRPIADYCVVLPKQADRWHQYAAWLFCDAVKQATGAVLPIVDDISPISDCEIRIGRTARGGESPFAVSFDGASLCLGQTADDPSEVIVIVRGIVARYLTDLQDGTQINWTGGQEIDCRLDSLEIPTPPDLAGKRAVALTDQKNAEIAVIDLDAPDITADGALLWRWKPTVTLGFSAGGFDHSIDEAKLRYDAIGNRFVVCVTSSAGFMGVAAYPSGECIWNTSAKIGPHSIEWLPNGNVAVASSGNGNDKVAGIRIYAASQGKINTTYAETLLPGAHAVVWDETLGVLWGLGHSQVCAYRIGGTDANPTIEEVELLRVELNHKSGHDMQPDPSAPGMLWIACSKLLRLDVMNGKFTSAFQGSDAIYVSGIKSIGSFADGTVVRSAATKVYKNHDTDTLVWFVPDGDGKYVRHSAVFTDRAFYKARIFNAQYGG
ncbi:MAG: hypothetical protein IKL84_07565 [Clostridia bacterium]|nr:hypothetical protein [Clostridia bacterium]